MDASTPSTSFFVVNNIPHSYRSKDLRKYFANFVESGDVDCFHYLHRPERKRRRQPDDEAAAADTKSAAEKSRCGLVRLRSEVAERFYNEYNNQRWQDHVGKSHSFKCFLSRVNISDAPSSATAEAADDVGATLSREDLAKMPEFRPPAVMPNGNVGTPTEHFLQLINACKLPPKVVENLGLDFKVVWRKYKQPYGRVAPTAQLHAGSSRQGAAADVDDEGEADEADDVESRHLPAADNDDQEGELDDDECEEWERHEAFKDDPGKQQRHGERLFEEDMEVVWEKGGPGLVFYTDAYHWDQQEEQDEKWADEWDVDMSVYYGKDADTESKQLEQMRRYDKLHAGTSESVFKERAGKPGPTVRKRRYSDNDLDNPECVGLFEKHTRGIGRKVLERQGWTSGTGLGATEAKRGKPYPVSVDLESSALFGRDNKTGVGYRQVQPQRRYAKRPIHGQTRLITTKYDVQKVHESDAVDGDRKKPLTALKTR